MIHYNPDFHKDIILQALRKNSYKDNMLAIAGAVKVFINIGGERYCVPGPSAFLLNMEAHNIRCLNRESISLQTYWCN